MGNEFENLKIKLRTFFFILRSDAEQTGNHMLLRKVCCWYMRNCLCKKNNENNQSQHYSVCLQRD